MRTRLGVWGLGLVVMNSAVLALGAYAASSSHQSRIGWNLMIPAMAVAILLVSLVGYALLLKPLARNAQSAAQSARDILDVSGDAIFIVGKGSKIEFASQSAARLLGYGPKEFVGMPTNLLIEDANAIDSRRQVVMNDANEVLGLSCDVRVNRKDGVSIPMNLVISESGHGRNKKRVWVMRDQTDVKRMQLELERSEDRFKALAECSPVAVFQVDTYGGLLYCNNRMMALFGLRREDLIGGGWADWINPEEREEFLHHLRQATIEGTGFSREIRIIQADRNLCWARCSFSPLLRQDGSLIGFVGSMEDITEIRTTRESLANSRSLIAEALDAFHIGFAIWDSQDRLVVCNPAYRSHYPEVSHALMPGIPYREVLKTFLESGGRNPFKTEEEYYAYWLTRLHHTGEPWDAYLQGKRVKNLAARTDSGNTVVILLEQQVAKGGQDVLFAEALDSIKAAFAIFDPQGRPVAHNIAYFDLGEDLPALEGDGGILEHNGRRLLYSRGTTPSGNIVQTLTDITALEPGDSASEAVPEVLESLPAGVAVYDSNDRLIYANPRMRAMAPNVADSLVLGTSYRDILRAQYQNMHLARLGVNEEAWIAKRMAEQGSTLAIADNHATLSTTPSGHKVVLHVENPNFRRAA